MLALACQTHVIEIPVTYDFRAPACQTLRTKVRFPGSARGRRSLIAARLGLLLELSRLTRASVMAELWTPESMVQWLHSQMHVIEIPVMYDFRTGLRDPPYKG